jgi:hypothetical protein
MKMAFLSGLFAFAFVLAGAPVASACPGGDKDPASRFCPDHDGKDPAACPGGDKDPASRFCPDHDGKDPA